MPTAVALWYTQARGKPFVANRHLAAGCLRRTGTRPKVMCVLTPEFLAVGTAVMPVASGVGSTSLDVSRWLTDVVFSNQQECNHNSTAFASQRFHSHGQGSMELT